MHCDYAFLEDRPLTRHRPLSSPSLPGVIDDLTELITRAADAVIAIDQSRVTWREKEDGSPVTAADETANRIIIDGMSQLLPGLPIISEETGIERPFASDCFALVDPLDGTREYLAGGNEFTVNIAIVIAGRPAMGLIAAPALGLVWRGMAGHGAERLGIPKGAKPRACEVSAVHPRKAPPEGFLAAVSRSHFDRQTDAFLQRLPIIARHPCGSSLKFCRIAEGSWDVYARLSQTCEWDIAAGDAILTAAGGIVASKAGRRLTYGRREDGFHVQGFVAWGDPCAAERFIGCRSRDF